MPGIAGIISEIPTEQRKPKLQKMLDCMMHGSFYENGLYDNNNGVSFGWVDHNPSLNKDKIVYNDDKSMLIMITGEFYRDEMKINNQLLKYILDEYGRKGIDALSELNGWFSGVIYNLNNNILVLFNDRYGINRLYYYEDEQEFIFSSEAKSILKIKNSTKYINPNALLDYFTWGCVLNNNTLYNNILLVPGGSAWIIQRSSKAKRNIYFDKKKWTEQAPLKYEEFQSILKTTFSKILPKYLSSNGDIALSLTGGLDTRMILANIKPGDLLQSYTYGGLKKDCYDVKIARKIADVCNLRHAVIPITREFIKNFSELARDTIVITNGCSSICGTHELFLSKKAREIASIRLTGNYGSEVFRSVNYIKSSPPKEGLLQADIYKELKSPGKLYSGDGAESQLSLAVFKIIPWLLYGRLCTGRSQLTVRTPYMDNELVSMMFQAPEGVRESRQTSARLIVDGNPELSKIMTDRGVAISHLPFYFKIFRYYREFLFKAEYMMSDGTPNWLSLLNRKLKPLNVDNLFLGNHKIEQYRIWFNSDLSDYVNDILSDQMTMQRPIYNSKYIIKLAENNRSGIGNNLNEIEKIISLELIHRNLLN